MSRLLLRPRLTDSLIVRGLTKSHARLLTANLNRAFELGYRSGLDDARLIKRNKRGG